MMKETKVAVVGGGIVGLVTAWSLQHAGYAVTVFDPAPGSGATFAAAGMLAPISEIAPGEEANFALQFDAVERWKRLAKLLSETTSGHIEVHEVGTLWCGFDAGDRRLVQQQRGVLESFGVGTTSVTRETNPATFEHLHPQICEGFFIENEAWVNPDTIVATLLTALRSGGARFVATTVTKVASVDETVRIWTADESFDASFAIVSNGVGGALTDSPAQPSLRPVRGITIRTHGMQRDGLPMVRAFVRGRPLYLIGRDDAHCVLGATSDEQRTLAIEAGELQRLLRDALEVFPALETAAIVETRVGLRPATSSGEPFFLSDDRSQIALSNGHYRHGVTLAPLAADWAKAFVAGGVR